MGGQDTLSAEQIVTSSPDDDAGRPARATAAMRFALPAALVLAAAGVIVSTTRYGIGLTSDSAVYAQGAKALVNGHGYTDGFGAAIVLFPPGYSVLLALLHAPGLEVLDAGLLLSILSFGTTVVLAWFLLRRHVRSPGIQCAATLLVGASAVMLDVYTKLLSEHAFVPVVLVFLVACEHLVEAPRAPQWVAVAIATSWIAFYLRYVGVVLPVVGSVVLLVAGWSTGRKRAVASAAGFGLACIAAPAVWAIRNKDASGEFFGRLGASSTSMLANVGRVADELAQWLSTRSVPRGVRLSVLAVAVGATLGLLTWLWRRGGFDWRGLFPLALFVVVYVGYIVASATVVAVTNSTGDLQTRFLIPVFVPLVVLGAWLFEHVRDALPRQGTRTVLTVLASLWVIGNAVWFVARAANLERTGAGGYATAHFHHSPLLRLVDHLDLTKPTYSNDPFAISVLRDKDVHLSPAQRLFHSNTRTSQLGPFTHKVACAGHVRLVWFLPNTRGYLYTPAELTRALDLRKVATVSDGVVYDVAPKPGVRCAG